MSLVQASSNISTLTSAIKGVSDILKSAPDEHELYDLLANISNEWREIGISLRLPFNTLDGLSRKPEHDNVRLSIVIHMWRTTSEQKLVTWDTVVAAFKKSKNLKKVEEICKFLASKAK